MNDIDRSKEDLIAELQQLRQRNRELDLGRDALWDAFPIPLVIIRASDGQFIYVNQHAKKLYGIDYSGYDLDSHLLRINAMRPDGSPFPLEEMPVCRSLVYGETVRNTEMIIQNINGIKHPVLVSSSPILDEYERVTAALVTFEDVIKLKLVECNLSEAVKLAEKRTQELNAVIQALPVGLIIYDKDGNIVETNGCCEAFFQALLIDKHEPLVDRAAKVQCYQLNGHPLVLEDTPICRTLVNGETIKDFEMAARNSIGEHIYISLNSAPVRNSSGEIIGAVATYQDITERMHVETALRKSKQHALDLVDKLFQADQNKNAFINMLSHELRNPLASIIMGVELIEKVHRGRDQVTKVSKIVRRQLKQLTCLLDDLLDAARIAENKIVLKKKPVELNEVVRQAIEDYQWQFTDNGIVLNTEFTTPLHLDADPVRLTQSVGNLLHNAVKFTGRDNEVYVTVSRSNKTKEALITIRDTGMGMDQEMLSNVFEPFLQADKSIDRRRGGLGLGLSIAKGIVDLHGGNITVESDGLGKGAQFTIRLPIPHQEGGDSEAESGGGPADRLKILVIDDMPDITEIMTALLKHLGHEVISASSGLEGIAKAKEFHPQVLFCDIGLPGMNGYEVAEYFCGDDELKDIYMIAFSGYVQPEDRQRSKEAGFKVHLAKPVELEALKEVLRTCCQRLASSCV